METENQTPNLETSEATPKASRSRTYILAVIALIAIIIIVLLVKNRLPENSSTQGNNIVKERLVNLDGNARKLVESQLAGYQEQLKGLGGDQFAKERDSLLVKLAGAQYKLGKYQDAVDTLSKISEEGKNTARVWGLYTNIYRDMGDTENASKAAQQALDRDRENPDFWLAVIEFSGNKSNDDQKKQYETALRTTDNNIEIVVSYAKFLEKIGDKPGAILYWQKAGQLDDKNKANYDAEVKRLQS